MPGYNKSSNSYNGIPVNWNNLQEFQILFLESQYSLAEVELKAKENNSNDKKIIAELNQERQEVVTNLKELYKITYALRMAIYNRYRYEEPFKQAVDEKAKNDTCFWINNFAWTFDPRLTNLGLPAKLPLVMFPAQEDIINKVEDNYRNNRSMLVEKSRGEGLTEILCAFDIHHFLYSSGYKAGWGSRTKYQVDMSNSQDTIFEKLRRILYSTPINMRPKQLHKRPNKWDAIMRLYNPENGSSIIGEGGDQIGRGGRSSFYKVDEKAFVEDQEGADRALSGNTNCQLDLSTPNGMNSFYQKRQSNKVDVITAWWWRNPTKNKHWRDNKRPEFSAWYKLAELKFDEVTVAQEIDVNYQASVGGSFIPSNWVMAAVDFNLPEGKDSVSGFDIAAGGKDKSTYINAKGVVVKKIKHIQQKTPLEATWEVADECIKDGSQLLVYDINALGEDVYPQLTQSDRKISFKLHGIRGQATASEDYIEEEGIRAFEKFRNLRAEVWWSLRKRFEKTFLHRSGVKFYPVEELISIPSHKDLIDELSTPLIVYATNGKIGVESKQAMKSRNISSPNWADTLAYLFAPIRSKYIGENFAYWNSNCIQQLDRKDNKADEIIVSLVLSPDNILYCIIAQFFYGSRAINILYEQAFEHQDILSIKKEIYSNFPITMPAKHWVGNERIFEGLLEGKQTLWYDFKKNGMPLKQNYSFDVFKSYSIIDEMFKNNKLKIDEECKSLINQIRHWNFKGNKPTEGFYYCEALLQMIQLMRKSNLITIQEIRKKPYYKKIS